MDSVGDGVLHWPEFWNGVQEFDIPFSEEEAREAFRAMDAEDTGVVNFEEFQAALRVRK